MTTGDNGIMTDADWEKVFNNPATLAVLDSCPPNFAEYHDEEEDGRILEDMRRSASWFNRIMNEAIAETEHGA